MLAAGDKELEAFGMATSGQVSGILRTENCSTCCLWEFLPHAVFDSVLTWHSMDTQAHTTKGDLRGEGFNSGCPLESRGEPRRFQLNWSEGTLAPSFLSSPGDSSGQRGWKLQITITQQHCLHLCTLRLWWVSYEWTAISQPPGLPGRAFPGHQWFPQLPCPSDNPRELRKVPGPRPHLRQIQSESFGLGPGRFPGQPSLRTCAFVFVQFMVPLCLQFGGRGGGREKGG